MNIQTASLSELARWIAGKTGSTEIAKVALSTSPQLRYDAEMSANILRNPAHRSQFSKDEQRQLAQRIADPAKRKHALAMIEGEYY